MAAGLLGRPGTMAPLGMRGSGRPALACVWPGHAGECQGSHLALQRMRRYEVANMSRSLVKIIPHACWDSGRRPVHALAAEHLNKKLTAACRMRLPYDLRQREPVISWISPMVSGGISARRQVRGKTGPGRLCSQLFQENRIPPGCQIVSRLELDLPATARPSRCALSALTKLGDARRRIAIFCREAADYLTAGRVARSGN